jgi:hypothetical protein
MFILLMSRTYKNAKNKMFSEKVREMLAKLGDSNEGV